MNSIEFFIRMITRYSAKFHCVIQKNQCQIVKNKLKCERFNILVQLKKHRTKIFYEFVNVQNQLLDLHSQISQIRKIPKLICSLQNKCLISLNFNKLLHFQMLQKCFFINKLNRVKFSCSKNLTCIRNKLYILKSSAIRFLFFNSLSLTLSLFNLINKLKKILKIQKDLVYFKKILMSNNTLNFCFALIEQFGYAKSLNFILIDILQRMQHSS
eukprot:TRINITY_DN136_c1_g2_i1.p1 TRINITY_DN136_c1_g2~~TRINITY_DN136_c1_g2_i1.p1  ORF type:complete len:213 (+),score=-21.81 TRINITY_DN136_c1_g2_i1:1091-1729(+)